MSHRIDSIQRESVGTTASQIAVDRRNFIIKNCSADATIYIKEYADDKKKATSSNSFPINPGQTLEFVLNAKTLSVVASAASTSIAIMYIGESY